MTETLPALLYQGSANAWECDEMGHLNVRFHVERAMTGLGVMAQLIGMPRAYQAKAGATLQPRDLHIRFLKEARAGAPLVMRGGVLEADENEALFYAELRHLDGVVSSTFTIRAAHAEPETLQPFAWSQTSHAALRALKCALPEHAAPRSVDTARAPAQFTRARADALAVPVTGRSIVMPAECDAFGRLRGEMLIGRVSDAVPWVLDAWRKQVAAAVAAADGVARQPGGAAVEFRFVPRAWPRAGEHIEVRSALAEVMPKANRLVHWLVDPVSGQAWASVEAVAITFDLITRKSYAAPDALREALQEQTIPQMTA